jgi:hypothetical protein
MVLVAYKPGYNVIVRIGDRPQQRLRHVLPMLHRDHGRPRRAASQHNNLLELPRRLTGRGVRIPAPRVIIKHTSSQKRREFSVKVRGFRPG